ncbi:MAG TPA: NACHT domain-containing protein [Nostoc sp.]|uniref:NACHT domain-containing protein n=1 Tax=Nostoc sp. TaxID=1180 RepID=UPI002D5251A8|nr:NACHT domain-containing protein [Nostoc sp.]HYX14411.1 NACHT domain-containing protein [Nostoc sp.]
MSQPQNSDSNQTNEPEPSIQQEVENSTLDGGMQAAQGNNIIQAQGNTQININYNLGSSQRPKNEKFLLAVVKDEVNARLMHSLHNKVLINLGKKLQPQQVKRPWNKEIKIGQRSPEFLSDTTNILEVFQYEGIVGRLLILGAPGSGKTTTQLDLAQALIKLAEEQPDYPMPVLFNLSSWKDSRQSIIEWLVAELKSKYDVSEKFGKEWIENKQLLPLLDGLDELPSVRQELCVMKINEFIEGKDRPRYMVVCSRYEEYRNLIKNNNIRLRLNGAIRLKALTNIQIQKYLTDINYDEIWQTISNDSEMLKLVKIPFILSLTTIAYKNITITEWEHLSSKNERLQYLINAYIERMLTREINSEANIKEKYFNTNQINNWLIFLAKMLNNDSQTEFLIEKIQPNLLQSRLQKFIYVIGVKIFFGVFIGLGLGLLFGLIFKLLLGYFFWLGSGLMIGLTIACKVGNTIKPVIPETWSWFNAKRGFVKGSIFGTSIGFLIGVVNEVFFNNGNKILSFDYKKIEVFDYFITKILIDNLDELYRWPLIFAIIFGITFGLVYGVIGSPVSIKRIKFPNQGIWYSAANAVRIFSIVALALGLSFWSINKLTHGVTEQLFNHPQSGLILGLIGGVNYLLLGSSNRGTASLACVQHFTLRLILYFKGYIPWNYAHFLDYCTERFFLQRIGGRYRFIHKILQDHFAEMNPKQN